MGHSSTRVFALIDVCALLAHEQVDEPHVDDLVRQISSDGRLLRPVVVDKDSYVILDGHHRVRALRRLGCRLIPAYLMDYLNDEAVTVIPRRNDVPITKKAVVDAAHTKVLFPPRSSRHVLRDEPPEHPVSLSALRAFA